MLYICRGKRCVNNRDAAAAEDPVGNYRKKGAAGGEEEDENSSAQVALTSLTQSPIIR